MIFTQCWGGLMSILDTVGCGMPSFFQYFSDKKLINSDHVLSTKDGFYMIGRSISSILISKGVETFPDREDRILECRNYFDDWFLFAVPSREDYVYGLLKMREQEHDLERGIRRIFLLHQRSGWMALICFQFMRCCLNWLSYGASISRPYHNVKKNRSYRQTIDCGSVYITV